MSFWYIILGIASFVVDLGIFLFAYSSGKRYGYDKGYLDGQNDGTPFVGQCGSCGWEPPGSLSLQGTLEAILEHHNNGCSGEDDG